jgi:hypothetical protein
VYACVCVSASVWDCVRVRVRLCGACVCVRMPVSMCLCVSLCLGVVHLCSGMCLRGEARGL